MFTGRPKARRLPHGGVKRPDRMRTKSAIESHGRVFDGLQSYVLVTVDTSNKGLRMMWNRFCRENDLHCEPVEKIGHAVGKGGVYEERDGALVRVQTTDRHAATTVFAVRTATIKGAEALELLSEQLLTGGAPPCVKSWSYALSTHVGRGGCGGGPEKQRPKLSAAEQVYRAHEEQLDRALPTIGTMNAKGYDPAAKPDSVESKAKRFTSFELVTGKRAYERTLPADCPRRDVVKPDLCEC